MTDLVKMHLANLTVIAGLTGHSKTDRTQTKALAAAYHTARLGRREDVEELVAGIEQQIERIKGIGGAFAPSCVKYLGDATAAVLKNHQDLLGSTTTEHAGNGRTSEVGFSSETTSRVGTGSPREDGRPVV